jgi:hypothetical protein
MRPDDHALLGVRPVARNNVTVGNTVDLEKLIRHGGMSTDQLLTHVGGDPVEPLRMCGVMWDQCV